MLSTVEAEFELVFEVSLILMMVPVTLFTVKVVSKVVPTKRTINKPLTLRHILKLITMCLADLIYACYIFLCRNSIFFLNYLR